MLLATFFTVDFTSALLGAGAIAIACAVLSVFVVSQRWAFIGEGIGHAGFGGAGTAWMLALAFPALDQQWVGYVTITLFCLATALVIGWVSRGQRVNVDATIGIFLVASLGWGFMAQSLYQQHRHQSPFGFDTILFGQMKTLSPLYLSAAISISAAVVLCVWGLRKEILAYCFDPTMAQVSGVRAGMIHYLLILLIAVMILVGMQIVGPLLVTALLVLPGATAMLISDRMRAVTSWSIGTALLGAAGGLFVNQMWSNLPVGPSIVLIQFLVFVVTFVGMRFKARAKINPS